MEFPDFKASRQPKEKAVAKKFKGSIEDLQAIVSGVGPGAWSENAGKHTFRGEDGSILNWWPSTGSLQFQGGGRVKELSNLFGGATLDEQMAGRSEAKKQRRQIFIVHGHDATSRDQLELALRRLGLEPFVLMNTSGGGQTIIEALEGAIGADFSSDFGIVLMTPDDVG